MKITKIKAGTYKLEIGSTICRLQDMTDGAEIMNPHKGWGVYFINDGDFGNMENWGCTVNTKKMAIEAIQEDFNRGLIK
jgi:hypothetical protein